MRLTDEDIEKILEEDVETYYPEDVLERMRNVEVTDEIVEPFGVTQKELLCFLYDLCDRRRWDTNPYNPTLFNGYC